MTDLMLMSTDLALRYLTVDDAPAVMEAVRESPDVKRWLPQWEKLHSTADLVQWVEAFNRDRAEGTAHVFVMSDSTTGQIQGICGLTRINKVHRFANVFYWVRQSCAGRSLAARSVRLLAQFGFETVQLNRLEIVVAVGNTASLRVAEKVGAVREGVLRHRLMVGGQPTDAAIFSLIAEDIGEKMSKP